MIIKRAFILVIFLLPILLGGVAVNGQTQSISSDIIAMNCRQAQGYLKNDLKNKDLKTRVDRLRVYQYMQKRVDHFVSRLERHHQPRATEMRLIVNQLDLAITSFKVNYEAYDAARENLTNLKDCSQNVDAFNDLLSSARSQLRKVRQSSDSIETLINERFMKGLDQLETALTPDEARAEQ